MSVALHAAPIVDDALRAKPHDARMLAYAIVGSIALHVLLVAVLPAFRKAMNSPPRPLEVVIVTPPVPQPVRVEPPPRVKPPRDIAHKPPPEPHPQPRPKPPPTAVVEPKPVLALPEKAVSAAPSFAVPQPAPAEIAPAAPAVPAGAVAAPAVAAPQPAKEPLPTTPPSFNAAYLGNAPPRYPLIARHNGDEGTVYLRVVVTRDGRAAQVKVDKSSGSSALDNAALEAVRGWKFVPARRGQETVEQPVVVPIVFKLEASS